MRLYLSSFRFGNHTNQLKKLTRGGVRVAIIDNATDTRSQSEKETYKKEIYDAEHAFNVLEFSPESLDLRDYFDRPDAMHDHLAQFDLIWVCGGNTFLLRRAMAQSGFDMAITKLLQEDKVAYGGWSAGICVLAPSLKGLELCDDAKSVAFGYNSDVIWSGLGVVKNPIIPHYQSNHPESTLVDRIVQYYQLENIKHNILRDGDVMVFDGEEGEILRLEDGFTSPINESGVSQISFRP